MAYSPTFTYNILLVINDQQLRREILRVLMLPDSNIRGAGSGSEGLRLMREQTPDLIVLESGLSDCSGRQFCRQIKADPVFKRTAVLLLCEPDLSSASRKEQFESCPDGFLRKPLSFQELVAAVRLMRRLNAVERRFADICKIPPHRHQAVAGEDMSGRKQTEATLQQLKTAVETMQVGVTITDLDHNIIYVNSAEARMHGYHADEVLGRPVALFSPPELRNPLSKAQIYEMQTLIHESINIRKDGSAFPVRLISDVVRNPQGEPLAVVTTCEDITERQNAEAELEAGAQRLHTIIETVGEGITLSDETGYFEIFNSKMEEITGYRRDEANGCKNFLSVLYPSPQEYQHALIGIAAMHEGGSRELETTIQTKDGVGKTLLVSSSILLDRNRRWFLSAYRDITERKSVERALQQAKVAAEFASHAKSEFLANMSHEFRTPLNGILGYAQILQRTTELNEQQRKGLGMIQRSGEHLLMLINDILDLSKIEAGKFELQLKAFNLSRMLKNLVEMVRFRAEEKGLEFVYEGEQAVPQFVQGDEKCLRQILLNLLGNAVKFTHEGRITFRVLSVEESGGQAEACLRFEVRDTGIGISSEHLHLIFSAFEQVKERQRYAEGTGLGLAISQRLTRMMGSELHVRSRLEAGSVFWFDLNLSRVDEAADSGMQPVRRIVGFKPRDEWARSPDIPLKVLIVDDQESNRVVLRDMLASVGFEIIEATNGRDALEQAMKSSPDIILMDLIMPVLDGFEATRRIRSIPALKDVIVLAISASAFEQTRHKSCDVGCNEFLAKPITEQSLFDILQRHLHVDWLYTDSAAEKEHTSQERQISEHVYMPPSQKVLFHLYQCAIIGDIMEIRQSLQELEKTTSGLEDFIQRMRQLAADLNILEIQQFLKRYLKQKSL